jgi:DNA-binding XRE family transcriptional regulator
VSVNRSDMWLQCCTQEEIAEAVGVHKDTISEEIELCRKLDTCLKSDKLLALCQDAEFETPIYNVWTFAQKEPPLSFK